MKTSMIALITLILIPVGAIFLQVYLSKMNNKYVGMILPSMSFMFSIIAVLSVFSAVTMNNLTDSNIALENTDSISFISQISQAIMIFVSLNLSTVVLALIYFGCRQDILKNQMLNKLNKMSIQDLE